MLRGKPTYLHEVAGTGYPSLPWPRRHRPNPLDSFHVGLRRAQGVEQRKEILAESEVAQDMKLGNDEFNKVVGELESQSRQELQETIT
jgi:hypothetical protein